MFLAVLAVAVTALALGGNSARAHAAAGPPPCEAKITKIGGKKALENCGPATVALTIGGHTYHYTHGYCSDSKSSGAKLDLDLGTLVTGTKGNAGEPYLAMLIPTAAIDGSVFEADYGGKQLLGDTLIKSSGGMTGTFKSDFPETPCTGTWNCHGVLWHAP